MSEAQLNNVVGSSADGELTESELKGVAGGMAGANSAAQIRVTAALPPGPCSPLAPIPSVAVVDALKRK